MASSAADSASGPAPSQSRGARAEPNQTARRATVRRGWLAIGWLVLVVVAAASAPLLPISDPNHNFPALKHGFAIAGPLTDGHLLGGDGSARDLFARVVWGARSSLLLAFAAVALGLVVGGGLGVVAGYFRGRVGLLVGGTFDILLAVPALVLALGLVAVLAPDDPTHPVSGTRRLIVLVIALGLVSIPVLGRVSRASALAWSEREFVLAARAQGASDRRIVVREVLPNVLPALLSIAFLGVAVVIVAEGGLSILGVGVRLPTPSWGNIIAESRNTIGDTPWPVLAPATAIFLTVLALNHLSEVVRSWGDTRESLLG